MTYLTESLPADLHIVSELDLWLLQRAAAVPSDRAASDGPVARPPWPEGALDRVLDEVERREFLEAGPREYIRRCTIDQ